jgi:photosystem II stability/assembly factor-like uncharacterized protein
MKKYILLFLLIISQTLSAQYWEKVTNIPPPYNNGYYLDLFILPSNTNYVWACGFEGYVIRSTNYGITWQGTKIPFPSDHMESVYFVNELIGYVSGVDGIWKSTDGGASFQNITPVDSTLYGFWGSCFLDANVGVLVGGGCDGIQRFYKTTNGGASWTLFTTNVMGTGLTDVILYPDGTGIAVSSGYLWTTSDFGSTWSLSKSTGSQVWQEEITVFGNSILLPYAGTTCAGDGSAGGMRFSTDKGNTWKDFYSGYPMFGAYLVSPTEGWASGYNRSVYYTSDAGKTWALRNCGIENVDLDDITFLNADDGWVVGQGVYHLRPTKITTNKDFIDFGEICYPEIRRDSLKIVNLSFFSANMQLSITGNTDNAFSLISPISPYVIQDCDSIPIVVQFSPPGNKAYSATLVINAFSGDGKTNFYKEINLTGTGNKSTVHPEVNPFIVDSVLCGTTTTLPFKWLANDNNGQVQSFTEILDDKGQITFNTKTPFYVPSTGINSEFKFFLADTGWVTQNYRFRIQPCTLDTIVTVKVYGYSPIINSIDSTSFISKCSGEILDTIPVSNTGNSTLIISKSSIVGNPNEVSIIGWKSGKKEPINIQPGKSDSIIIAFRPTSLNPVSYLLTLDNNDLTSTRGNKNPLNILLIGKRQSEEVQSSSNIINFGKVCINSTKDTVINLQNIGNILAKLSLYNKIQEPYELETLWDNTIKPKEQMLLKVSFTPTKSGKFNDSLFFKTGDCNTLKIYLTGTGVESKMTVNPNSIVESMKSNETKNININITNIGSDSIVITNYYLNPPTSLFSFDLTPSLSQFLDTNQTLAFNLQVNSQNNATYKGTICFEANGLCPINLCIPVELSSIDKMLVWNTDSAFGNINCNGIEIDTIWIKNIGSVEDTLTDIKLNGDASFNFVNPPTLPYYIASGDSLGIIVKFENNNGGNYSSTLTIQSIAPDGQILSFPLNVNFKKSIINLSQQFIDFGTFEKCDSNISRTFTISNTGNLDDIASVLDEQIPSSFEVIPTNNLNLSANSVDTIFVTFSPAKADSEGIYQGYIIWVSNLCGDTNKISFKAEIIAPHLIYSKKDIDFSSVWVGDVATDSVSVYNPSTVIRKITAITYPQNFKVLSSFPISIDPYATKYIYFSFNPFKDGNFDNQFVCEEASVCRDTIVFNLAGTAPFEQYFAEVSIDDYTANVDDTLMLAVKLNTKLPRVTADSIQMQLSFDKYLLYPLKLYSLNSQGNFSEHNFSYSNGTISSVFSSQESDNIFNLANTIIQLRGIALASNPTFTPLKIDDFNVFTTKNLVLTKKDGSLTLNPICLPEAENHIIIYPQTTFSIISEPINKSTLELSFENIRSGDFIEIFNLIGSKVFEEHLKKGSYKETIDFSQFQQGLYFIRLNAETVKISKFINNQ